MSERAGAARRLPPAEGELIDRGRALEFSFDGAPVSAFAGDTVASALYAAGRRVFSRSFKYHRPRGLLCCAGQCPNCLVRVDDEPAVPACVTPAADGMRVEHVNAWPSLERDVLSLGDRVGGPLMQVGFYYKTFLRPRRLWPLYERVLRSAAGVGRVDPEHRRERRFDKIHRHVDVLVIGGGRSGLEAAIRAAGEGAGVLLVEEGLALGGRLAYGGPAAAAQARELADRARRAGVEILQPAYAGGVYEGLLVPVFAGDVMHRVRAGEVVLATGRIEQPLVFPGNDLPGVMLAGAARRLIGQFRLAPGGRAVLVAADHEGLATREALAAAGVEVVAVADLCPDGPGADGPAASGAPAGEGTWLPGFRPVRAHGARAVRAVTLQRGSEQREVACDLLVLSGGAVVDAGLLRQAGGALTYDAQRRAYVPDRLPDGVRLAGSREPVTPPTPAHARGQPGKQFVCFCEDVTTKDVVDSLAEGFTSLELSKRYTTVTMGPCQGRMCQRNSALVLAQELGVEPDARQVGTTTARPPISRPASPCWPAAAMSPRGAPRCTTGTPPTRARSPGRGTGCGPTTTAIPTARWRRCTSAWD